MAKPTTTPLSEDSWKEKRLENEKYIQQIKQKQKIMSLNQCALNGSFEEFKNAVGECVKGMEAIPETIFYEPLQLAAGSKCDSDQKVKFLLNNNYISNVNLEMKASEVSMTLLGWALTNKKSELVKLLLEKGANPNAVALKCAVAGVDTGADPNALALKHQETFVSYTAVGLVFNDFYQYELMQTQGFWFKWSMKLLGMMPNPKIDENQVKLLVKHGANLSQAAIVCGNEAALIPSQNPLVAQLPCVQKALAIESGKEVTVEERKEGEESKIQILEDDTEASGDNTKVQQNTATPGEGAEQERKEVDGAFGSGEKSVPTEQPKSWFSKVFSFSWLNFWSSKSGDMQNANTTSAVGVKTENEVPEPDSVDQLGQTPELTKASWYSGVSKFFGNIGNKVLSLVGLGSEMKDNGAGENSDENVFSSEELKKDANNKTKSNVLGEGGIYTPPVKVESMLFRPDHNADVACNHYSQGAWPNGPGVDALEGLRYSCKQLGNSLHIGDEDAIFT
jgi:hypothetical protein